MIEITGNDVKELSDGDLRSLVGLLCEADLRAVGLPIAGVTWGGHQNASDGGIDVRVELTTALSRDGFVPRSKTGFQVKKPDMPHSAILTEMRPRGMLRQVIKELADVGGAYIIVSSKGSTADSALTARKNAMREALSDYQNASDLKVDFYDRERIAGWVRSHPSLVLWVRGKIGRPLQGWKSYENWSGSPGGIQEQYILDEHIRIHNSTSSSLDGVSAVEGINELRTNLHSSGSSVRLVGLSGVGKTRFVQSLFDERIGENPLNQSQVFYTDMSDSPNPDPRSFAESIIAQRIPAILVIDNCTPELHKRLTSVCSASGSLVSLITVEYDVRDDQPDETEVFRLEPASADLIEKLITSRFLHVSSVDRRTISNFSGGNARIAIALANTIRRGENLGNLRDDQLFTRLFHQRNEINQNLLRTAEVCSLVYSFDFQTAEGANDELRLLGSLIDLRVQEVYLNVKELQRRDLVQQRSKWRAVLPHAVANRLAGRALENIPLENILDVFEKGGCPRLLKSFSKRLSYLHESEEALVISRNWLAEDGLLGDVSKLDELGIALLMNIAPINPELTLSAIERVSSKNDAESFFSRENEHYNEITRLLRSLAYDKQLFTRSVELLYRFALSENPNENYNSIRDLLKSLFYLHLSGTHATPKQRLNLISTLIGSNFKDKIELGFFLLSSALESWHFNSYHGFEFGAHSRNYGYSPKTTDDIKEWYTLFIQYTISLAISDFSCAPKAKLLLAEKFRGLWVKAGMYDELEKAANMIGIRGSWKEGWLAVKTTNRFDGEEMDPEVFSRLNNLAVILEPTTLIERAKLYALSGHRSSLDLVDTVEIEEDESTDDYIKVESITRSLGREVGSHEEIFKEILPDLLSNEGVGLISFGEGLAEGCHCPEELWRSIVEQLSLLDEGVRNFQLLRGVLKGTAQINRNLAEQFLDLAVTEKLLGKIYPWLQTSIPINSVGVERLKRSLEIGLAPILQYGNLAYGRSYETIKDDALCELLKLITLKPEGITVAIKILHMRLHGHSRGGVISDAIISTGQQLLTICQFERKDNRVMDYELSTIIKACFTRDITTENGRILSKKLFQGFENYDIHPSDYKRVMKALATSHPFAYLDSFLEEGEFDYRIQRVFSDGVNPLSEIDDVTIINWCEENPKVRYPIVASAILPFQKSEKNKNELEWTELALGIIANSYDSIEVLNKFRGSFRPWSWKGSRAEIMQQRLCLISDLKTHEDTGIVDWASKEESLFEQEVRAEREWESKWENDRNESFE
ncbi:hypothetical protein ACM6Q7_14100 [Peribacillus butanolivorans]|uniref:hypothetical protein n=1 Tax=Peribacillus butanolivorans TaxID=421767 RepID=UPI0039FC1080